MGESDKTPPWGSDDEFNPQKAWDLIQNLRGELKTSKDTLAATTAKVKTVEGERDAALKQITDKDEAGKSESEKLAGQIADLETKLATEAEARLRAEVVAAKGLTPAQAKRLSGASREELEADADELLEAFPTNGAAGGPPSTKPRPSLSDTASGGGNPQDTEEKVDPAKLAEAIPRP